MKTILTILLIITALNSSLSAKKNITLKWLKQQPTSYAKDFYIWRYLNQNITPKEANKALAQVRRLNNKILYRYINKSKDETLKDYKSCMKAKTKDLIGKKPYCIEAGLSVYDATKLSKKDLTLVLNKVKDEYPLLADKLKILNSPTPFQTLASSEAKTIFDTFNQVGGVYRVKHFNQYLPKQLLKKLKYEKKFAQTIKLIVTNLNMRKSQISLLQLSPENLKYKSVFHLAINAIRHKKEDFALIYLEDAYTKAYYQMQKDNITFWQYQLTTDKKYLELLNKSWDVNLYTLYAKNILKQKHTNIIYDIKLLKDNPKYTYDISDPFAWLKVLKQSKKMDDKKLKKYKNMFTSEETLGHLSFVKERYDRYRNSYFVTPYENYMRTTKKNMSSLIYAIGRQESRFIPTSLSTAYAMGTMQIMPFLSKALAKQLKDPYDIDMQLDAKTNIRYAKHHLKYLKRAVKHPLFIAYAYNGGIGFTKRLLKQKLFSKGKYEPYLSMELLPYDETKKYGKKVLANYFIYQNHLNNKNKISFDSLIEGIKN